MQEVASEAAPKQRAKPKALLRLNFALGICEFGYFGLPRRRLLARRPRSRERSPRLCCGCILRLEFVSLDTLACRAGGCQRGGPEAEEAEGFAAVEV